jgi:hypothetical protein
MYALHEEAASSKLNGSSICEEISEKINKGQTKEGLMKQCTHHF